MPGSTLIALLISAGQKLPPPIMFVEPGVIRTCSSTEVPAIRDQEAAPPSGFQSPVDAKCAECLEIEAATAGHTPVLDVGGIAPALEGIGRRSNARAILKPREIHDPVAYLRSL